MRKKIDNRIRTLIENGVASRQRSMFVVVGDRGRDQVSLICLLHVIENVNCSTFDLQLCVDFL